MRRVWAWLRHPANRWVAAALVVGFVARLAWVVFATRPPVRLSDPWHYQEFARSFSYGATAMIGDRPTAFFPSGYSMPLAPLAWLTRKSGFLDLPMAASLLNVAAGTATIAAVASLARSWIGARSRSVAAWIMAVAPAHVYLTSTAFSETVFTAVLLLALVLVTRGVDRGWSPLRFVGVGAVVGYASLVRSPGIVVLAAIPLAVRARSGGWRGWVRPLLASVAGVSVVLAPWTVRNGVQVGIWTPTSTNNVATVCLGNWPGADGRAYQTAAEGKRCFRHSPMDNPALYLPGQLPPDATVSYPDEPRWYRTTMRSTARWILDNPGEQPRLLASRFANTFRSDTEALSDAEGFGANRLVGPTARSVLNGLANAWLWSVMALAATGLALVRRCRAALPIVGLVVLQVLTFLPGIALQRYHHPIVPLLAVLAAAMLTEGRSSARRAASEPDPAPS